MVVRLHGQEVLVALVQEPGFRDFVLPKGHVEPGETPEQAARREIEEEAGVSDLDLVGLLGVKERLNYDKTEWKKTTYFLFSARDDLDVSENAKGRRWFRIDRLPALFWPEQTSLLADERARILELMRGRASAQKLGSACSKTFRI